MAINNLAVLGLEITQKCNFDCVHCYLGKKNGSELNIEFITNMLNSIGEQFYEVYITGGEPLLHPQFIDIYIIIRNRGFFVNIFTNGSLFLEKIKNEIKHVMPHKVEISIYGMSEETYQNVTGRKGVFESVLKNILYLNEHYEKLYLKYVVMTINYHEMQQFKQFCEKYEINYSMKAEIVPGLSANMSPLNYRLKPEVSVALLKSLHVNYNTDDFNCDAGQNVFLHNHSIIQNIIYPKNIYQSKSDILEVLKKLNLSHKNIDELAGEEGKNLSGGEKVRISFARAIYKNSDILILDEVTSALDRDNEKLVVDMLKNLKSDGKTIILISHSNNEKLFALADQVIDLQSNKLEKENLSFVA